MSEAGRAGMESRTKKRQESFTYTKDLGSVEGKEYVASLTPLAPRAPASVET